MKTLFAILLLAIAQRAPAAIYTNIVNPLPAVQLTWTASGDPGVVGYNLYWGTQSRAYTNFNNASSSMSSSVSNLVFGTTYYFAATAYTINGLESDFSNEVTYVTPKPPAPPGGLNQPVVLQVQWKASVTDPAWADTPMYWSIDTTNLYQVFRLKIHPQIAAVNP